jgi:hypothetical protein
MNVPFRTAVLIFSPRIQQWPPPPHFKPFSTPRRHRPRTESCSRWPKASLCSAGVLYVAPPSTLHAIAGPRRHRSPSAATHEAAAPWRRGPRRLSASGVWRPAFGRQRPSVPDMQLRPRPLVSWPEHNEEEERRREKSKKMEKILVMKFEVELCNGWMFMNVVMNANFNFYMYVWMDGYERDVVMNDNLN